jgi:2-phospho-L-lactate transferase/gluconeogenesis factor (CofD/UPF0052 family)
MVDSAGLPIPSARQVREEYASRGQYDFVVPGGGHGAAAVCRLLAERGHTVAGVANPVDEGGHSARLRWDLYRRLGYWPIIPGDTMNLLGGGFAHPAIYAVTNTRLPKDTGGKTADALFAEALDSAAAKAPSDDARVIEEFRPFLVAIGGAVQLNLVDPGLTSLAGASLQNLLHCGVMMHVGAYRQGTAALDQERYLCGSYLLEREMKVGSRGLVLPMSFDKVTLVTKHACGRTVVGGINRVLLARGAGANGLEYGEMVPNSMLVDAPPEPPKEESRRQAGARVVDWHSAEVEHGPTTEPFDNDWVFEEIRPFSPRINPFLAEVLRRLRPGGTIVIPPGNAHESTYTFFLLSGLWEELVSARSRGVRVILVCNPMNLLLTAGYAVDDYLRSMEQALRRATGDEDIAAEQIIDRVVVNDPSDATRRVREMMDGEGIPPEVKQELLHRTPTGAVSVSSEEKARLESRGIEVIHRSMLSVETVSIRGIKTEAVSYDRDRLFEALL